MRFLTSNPISMLRRLAGLQLAEMDRTLSDNQPQRALHKDLVTHLLERDAMASPVQRRAAFDNARLDEPLSTLIDKVAMQAYKVTDEDIAAVKAFGLSENQIYELVVCAAVGQATRQYDTALAALAKATAGKGGCEHAA